MKRVFLIFIALLILYESPAQSLRSYVRAGDEAFQRKNYAAALQLYGDVLKRRGNDLNIWWKYAESARLYQAYQEALQSYKKIIDQPRFEEKYPLVYFRIGEVKKSLGDYDGAIHSFTQFLELNSTKIQSDYPEQARTAIEQSLMAKNIAASPPTATVTHLGKQINSVWNEFAPTVVGDTLFYASNRFDKKGERGKEKAKMNKILLASKGGRGREPGRGFPSTDTAHIAHTAFSPDGHYVFYTVCKGDNPLELRCELWLTAIDRRNRWLPGIRLPEPINLPGFTTTQPNIGYDHTLEGPVLWFASDRPGGKGKLDLWSVPLDTNFFCPCNLPLPGKKMTYLPDFEIPVNAETLNTAENDGTPFFHPGMQRLYFSSDGRPGLGGYDIYYADKKDGQLGVVENAGPGLNTSFNDLYLFFKPDGSGGYLSSNRPGALYLDEKAKAACHDIFSFQLTPKEPELPPASDSIAIAPPPPSPAPPVSTPPPSLTDFKGLPLYFDNDEPDKRTRKTSTKKNYEETVRSYLDRQDEYREKFSSRLKEKEAETAAQAIDDFFEMEIRKGYDRLGQLTSLMEEALIKGEKLEVLIKGFTSPRAESDYNLNLGKRRVSSVRNHFESWSDGALRPYLTSGQLLITEISFGETTARTGISDRLGDERNSIYHPDAARERRVEIVEIRTRQ
jgi:tetratricopeptide (TPR) repeat protein/outer membrane protein OmpA-like peptidoglycan-associated protein